MEANRAEAYAKSDCCADSCRFSCAVAFWLIALCRRDPTEENLAALRRQVAVNYDAAVARKKAKLEELKRTAKSGIIFGIQAIKGC